MINIPMFASRLKHIWPYFFLALCVFLVSGANLTPHTSFGHSAGLDATRLFELDRGVGAGDLYPRWSPDMYFGYGSPLLALYAPLAYFVAEVFLLAGMTMTWAMKFSYLAATVLAALGMFLLARHEYEKLCDDCAPYQNNIVGIAAALIYILAPYFLVDLYVRAAAAELYGFGLIPWVIFFLALFRDTENRRFLGGAAVAYGLLCFCHNISSMIYSPAIAAWILICFPRRHWVKGGFVLATGLAIGAFFWFPALGLKNAVQSEAHLTTGYFAFDRHFIAFADLFLPRWGYQPPGAKNDIMSLQLGLAHWGVFALSLIGALILRTRKVLPYLLMALGAILFTQPVSRVFWIYVPLLKFVQFPWRFLMIATFAVSALTAFSFAVVTKYSGKRGFFAFAATLLASSLFLYLPYAKAKFLFLDAASLSYTEIEPGEILQAANDPGLVSLEAFMSEGNVRNAGITGMASDDFLPVAVKRKPVKPAEKPLRLMEGSATISDVRWKFNECGAVIDAATDVAVVYESFYFPGWKAKVNGEPHPVEILEGEGTILLRLPPGKHDVKIYYGNAPIHTIGDIITILGMIAAAALIFLPRRR